MGARERVNPEHMATKRQKMNTDELEFYTNLGNRLKNYINQYNISMEYVKEILGVHRETVYMTLDGRRKINALELYKYSKLLKVSVDELMDNDKEVYMDRAVFDEYNKLTTEEKKEIYNYMRFKNSEKDSINVIKEMNETRKEIKKQKEEVKEVREEQLSLIEDFEII